MTMQCRQYWPLRLCRRRVKLLVLLSVIIILSALLRYVGSPSQLHSDSKRTDTGRPSHTGLNAEQQIFAQSVSPQTQGKSSVNTSQLLVKDTLGRTRSQRRRQPHDGHGVPQSCAWVNRSSSKPPYFLTAVMHMRIYKTDKAKLTTAELTQWLLYMSYIGVEHVYVYDGFYTEDEVQRQALEPFIRDNYVTYTDWHEWNPFTYQRTKIPAYQHCIDNYKADHVWQTALDIDEYPFSPNDTNPGFLSRFLENVDKVNNDMHSSKGFFTRLLEYINIVLYPPVSEILMENHLFLGMPLKKELLIERMWRRTPKVSNSLCKPVYRSEGVRHAGIHHNKMKYSTATEAADTHELRMNHYWGARVQDWGPDTEESLSITIEDRSMEPIVKAFKDCEAYLRKYMPRTDGNYTYG